MRRLLRRIQSVVRRSRVRDDIQREIDLHIAMETEHRVRQGMTAEEARRTALRDFGGVSRFREETHDSRGMTVWDSIGQDLRFGVRALRRSPLYAAATIGTLALGIGANTAIFTVVNDVLLQPLPYTEGDRLVRIAHANARPTPGEVQLSINERLDYERSLTTIDDVVEYHSMSFVLLNRGEPDEVQTGVVSSNYFGALGVTPTLGRDFSTSEDDLGAEPVLLLSHGYWQTRFAGDPDVVGQQIEMNERMHTIIGVLPPIPAYPESRDVYVTTAACPMRSMAEHSMAANRRTFAALLVFGRLARGATIDEADAEVSAMAGRFAADHPEAYRPAESGFQARVVGLNEEMVSEARPILLGLLAATGLVLLIACANVANLTLARALRRDREIALRTALGAGRGRLLRLLLIESTLISLAGGMLGLVVAWLTMDGLGAFASRFTSRVVTPSLDPMVLAFTLFIALGTGLLFGSMPVLSARRSLTSSLKDGAAGSGRRGGGLRSALVMAQVALSFALLVGAGLFLQSLLRLSRADLGYETAQVLTARIPGSWSHTRMPMPGDVERFYRTIAEKLDASPAVTMAAFTNAVPLSDGIRPFEQPIRLEGADEDRGQPPLADRNIVSERYFELLGAPLLAGRAFTTRDRAGAPPVAIINQRMAQLWGGRDPLGRRFTSGPRTYTVVGIVGDIRQYDVQQPALAQYYTPFLQSPGGATQVLLRTEGDPLALVPVLKEAVHAADPTAPIEAVRPLRDLVAGRMASPRLNAMLISIFAGLALVITLAGLWAAMATSVAQRTREFGLRMALGSTRSSVLRLVLRQGLTHVIAGLALGVGSALVLTRALASRLYQTEPLDPWIYGAVAALFLFASVTACLGPARRATAIDPIITLRAE